MKHVKDGNLKVRLEMKKKNEINENGHSFPNELAEFTYYRTYSRWSDKIGRRENHLESTEREIAFFKKKFGDLLTDEEYDQIRQTELKGDVLASRRLHWSAGKAAEINNICIYNCSYLVLDTWDAFAEMLYLLMCFHPDTLVQTDQGHRKINDVKVGDKVLSYDEIKKEFAYKTITSIVETPSASKKKLKITMENGEAFYCTYDHQWLTENRGWVKAEDLALDDDLVAPSENSMFGKHQSDETKQSIKIIKIEDHHDDLNYLDISVEDTHNFVLANGSVVHNCGTGVGFSVEREHVEDLPKIKKQKGIKPVQVHVIGDSKDGWCDALKAGLFSWSEGLDIEFDYSKIRPHGARLKTMGGRASGPAPLKGLLDYTRALLLARQGRRLSTLDCHDLACKIADIVVVGGVRRSSLISLSDLNDHEIRDCKSGNWFESRLHRKMANNSAVYYGRPSYLEFMEEWMALAKSGSGERGIFNREAARKMAPKRRNTKLIHGMNPCGEVLLRPQEFCVAGDTPLITRNGIYNIQDMVGKTVDVWNGEEWSSVTPRKTGESQRLVKVLVSDGSYLKCTPDHRFSVKNRFMNEWVEVRANQLEEWSDHKTQFEPHRIAWDRQDAMPHDDPYTLGFILEDGIINETCCDVELHGVEKIGLVRYLDTSYVSDEATDANGMPVVEAKIKVSAEFLSFLREKPENLRWLAGFRREDILKFLAGWADANGSQANKGIRLTMNNARRAEEMQLLLTACGIQSSISLGQKKGTVTDLGPRNDDLMYLRIANAKDIPCHRLDTTKVALAKSEGKYQTLQKVVELEGLHDTYCFNEPLKHKAVFGNLLTFQCNLTEVVARPEDKLETLEEKIKIAAMIGTMQSCFTDFPYLRPVWKHNCEEERLLGVSITGQMDCPLLRDPKTRDQVFDHLKKVVIDTNIEYAKRFGINQSVATTSVKPSGTVSLLADSASGLHPRFAKYYIRRVRIAASDPLFKLVRDAGAPIFPEVGQDADSANTWVVEFPIKAPEGAITVKDVTAIDQLEHWKSNKICYTEHNPSCTTYVRDDEWMRVGQWVWDNFDIIGGLSFLPLTDHIYALAPYEEISEEEYNMRKENFPKINYSQLSFYEQEDHTAGSKEYACTGNVCELV